MKTAVVMLLSLAGLSCAQDKKPENNNSRPDAKQSEGAGEMKRLQSVTWDLNSHKLVWVVQHGVEQNGQFVAKGSDRYEISPDEATMKFANEQRGFTREEATSLHKLLDTLSLYCAESVIWWDQGQGEPVDGSGSGNGDRVEQPRKEESKPAKKVLVAFEK
jgi:hypothetical protein